MVLNPNRFAPTPVRQRCNSLRSADHANLTGRVSLRDVSMNSGGRTMPATDFSFSDINGADLPMERFAGKPVLLVNVASACGFTPQYTDLQRLHNAYGPKGLVVLGVPSNDFGAQEPRTEPEIAKFCETMYGVKFPLTSKQKVIGPDAHALYQWIAQEAGEGAAPKWNFHKYLIGKDGSLQGAWPSRVRPGSDEITGAIEKAL
jgi:glutathione peroxidase